MAQEIGKHVGNITGTGIDQSTTPIGPVIDKHPHPQQTKKQIHPLLPTQTGNQTSNPQEIDQCRQIQREPVKQVGTHAKSIREKTSVNDHRKEESYSVQKREEKKFSQKITHHQRFVANGTVRDIFSKLHVPGTIHHECHHEKQLNNIKIESSLVRYRGGEHLRGPIHGEIEQHVQRFEAFLRQRRELKKKHPHDNEQKQREKNIPTSKFEIILCLYNNIIHDKRI